MYKNFPISAWTVTIGERGDNRGKKGKGHQGTCIKDPWTKPKVGQDQRWVVGTCGGGGCGRNTDNCTCTTIKN